MLVDSGSTDCFVDSHFITTHKLPFQEVNPLPLALIDGTVNQCVSHVVTLLIHLTLGYSFVYELYVTRLNKSYSVVLEYDWLKHHNPRIDWRKGIMNPSRETPRIINPTKKDPKRHYQEKTRYQEPRKPSISFVNAIAYQ